MRYSSSRHVPLWLAIFSIVCTATVQAKQVICVWDPLGAQGEGFSTMRDYALTARGWGAELELRPYVDERVAMEDFKAGQCDGAMMSGLRARQFVPFTGSIDSIGAIPSYTHMRNVIDLLADPRLTRRMINGPYEFAGAVPLGAAYAFVNDRNINSMAKAAGKKVAVLDWDKSQAEVAKMVGAQPVASDITNFAGKFNNGQVDIVFAPIVGYNALELYKGLGSKGGIARYPVVQVTAQLLIRSEKFPADFGLRSRALIAQQVPRFFGIIRNVEREVDPKHWMNVPLSERDGYEKVMRELRIHLTKAGYYDKSMMSLLKRVRCKREPDHAECSMTDE